MRQILFASDSIGLGKPPYLKEFCDAIKGTIDEKECFTVGSSRHI